MAMKPRPMSGLEADMLIADGTLVYIEDRNGWVGYVVLTSRDGQYATYFGPTLSGPGLVGRLALYNIMAWATHECE